MTAEQKREHVLTPDDKCPCGQPQEGSGYCSYECFSKFEMGAPIEHAPSIPVPAAQPGRGDADTTGTETEWVRAFQTSLGPYRRPVWFPPS